MNLNIKSDKIYIKFFKGTSCNYKLHEPQILCQKISQLSQYYLFPLKIIPHSPPSPIYHKFIKIASPGIQNFKKKDIRLKQLLKYFIYHPLK